MRKHSKADALPDGVIGKLIANIVSGRSGRNWLLQGRHLLGKCSVSSFSFFLLF